MNILKRELKAGRKAFIFWCIGLFVLVFASIIKFTGIEAGGAEVEDIVAQFPRPLQAMFGLVGVNISQIDGYYAAIVFYVMVCIAIYAISLGANAVGREAVDKTYEFVFTKPCSRSYILAMKLASGVVYLVAISLINYLFSVAALATLKLEKDISSEVLLFSVSEIIVGLVFFTMSAMIVSVIKRSEKGFLYGNICFLVAFIIGMLYDMLENAEFLRLFTPLRFFIPSEILNGTLNVGYVAFAIILCSGFTTISFINFEKKDLQASS